MFYITISYLILLQVALARASDKSDAWFVPTDRAWRHRFGAAPAAKEIGRLTERECQPSRLPLECVPEPISIRDLRIQKYLTSIGSNGVYYTRRSSNVELALDLPSLNVKDAAFGTALHEFAESYFPQYLAYR